MNKYCSIYSIEIQVPVDLDDITDELEESFDFKFNFKNNDWNSDDYADSDSDDYEYLRRRLLGATYVLNNGFSLIESNFSSKYLNIKEGIRKTSPCVEEQDNSIHIFGPCITPGYMVSDKNTIASEYIKEAFNIYFKEMKKDTFKIFLKRNILK